MKILYIDNRQYGHNIDIHINFIAHMEKSHEIIGYGTFLERYLTKTIKPNIESPKKGFERVINKFKPDVILTYNCNGSSYEAKLDNISLYDWISEPLSRVDIPKFHITTDYCRSGFIKEQADWFKDLKYSASFFRHKAALKYPIEIDAFWLPFSVDKKMYTKYSITDLKLKQNKVGFLGAAHDSAKELYINRIKAIDYLLERKMLQLSKVTDELKFKRQIFVGPEYIKFLTKNLFGLTCGGTCNFFTAKYLQIPASYSMLVCTQTDGLDLFPKDTYILYDKSNLDNMFAQLEEAILHKKRTTEKIRTLNSYVIDNHNHDIRTKQLVKIMKRYI